MSKDERCFFLCERHEQVCETSEVLNEDSNDANGPKEGLHFREVFSWTPVNDFVNSQRVGDVAFWGANMPYNGDFSCAQ